MATDYNTNGGGGASLGTAVLTKLIDDKVGNKQARTLMHIVDLFENHINERFDKAEAKVGAEFEKVYAEIKKVDERVDKFEKNTNEQFAELRSAISGLEKYTQTSFFYLRLLMGVIISMMLAGGAFFGNTLFRILEMLQG